MSNIPANASLMIIGSMKSGGTSSLYKNLVLHPEICPGVLKEPEYFSQNQNIHGVKTYGIPANRYEDVFPNFDPQKHKFVLDASTGYTKYPEENGVAERIKEYGLEPIFIYIVRNPFDRIVSHYHHYLNHPKLPVESLPSQLSIDISKYYTQLQKFKQVFPKSKIIIIDLDDLNKDTHAVADKIYDIIGLEPIKDRPKPVIANTGKKINIVEQYIKKEFLYIIKKIPNPILGISKKLIKMFYPSDRRKLSVKQKRKIYEDLKEDMTAFQQNYGFDVSEAGGFKRNELECSPYITKQRCLF